MLRGVPLSMTRCASSSAGSASRGDEAGREVEQLVLLRAELVREAVARQLDVVVAQRRVRREVALQHAAFGQTHGQQVLLAARVGVLQRAVAEEAANAVEHLAGAQVALGD